jgi:hypothetical protein
MARKQIRCHQNGLLTRPQEQTPTSNKGKPEDCKQKEKNMELQEKQRPRSRTKNKEQGLRTHGNEQNG